MKNKIVSTIVSISLLLSLTACAGTVEESVSAVESSQVQSVSAVAAPAAEESEPEKEDDPNRVPAEWKQLYMNHMQSEFTADSGYNTLVLADVTENGIPVLLYTWGVPGTETGVLYHASTVSNGKVVDLVKGGTLSAFVKSKSTGEYYAIFTAVRAMYANASVCSPNPDGALPWKETYQLRTEYYEHSNPSESYYIQDGVKHQFESIDEIQKYLEEGLDKTPAGAIYESTEQYELLHFPAVNLTSAQSWQQAETLISAFFDEYDGYADNVTAGGGASTEAKQVRIDADGGLRMRSGAGTDYDIIAVIPKNALVELATGEKDNPDWIYVSYGGEYGWISKEFVSNDLEPPKAAAGDWAKVYYDYLSGYEMVTALNVYEETEYNAWGRNDNGYIRLAYIATFWQVPGYDYPIMILIEGVNGYPAIYPQFYLINQGKLVEKDSLDGPNGPIEFDVSGRPVDMNVTLYDKDGFPLESYDMPAFGHITEEFHLGDTVDEANTKNMQKALDWLKSQQ